MEISILNPLDSSYWDDQLFSHEEPSVFTTSNWARVLKNSYDYSPVYCAAQNDGMVTALLPVMEVKSILTGCRGVSIPFTDYCDVSSDLNTLRLMIDRMIAFGKKSGWKYLELRGGQHQFGDEPVFDTYYKHVLPLRGDKREILAGFRNSTVRNIKKAIESGVETEILTSMDAVNTYYQLHCLTRKRLGVPPQPLQFFKNVHEYIISKGMGFVVIASFKIYTSMAFSF